MTPIAVIWCFMPVTGMFFSYFRSFQCKFDDRYIELNNFFISHHFMDIASYSTIFLGFLIFDFKDKDKFDIYYFLLCVISLVALIIRCNKRMRLLKYEQKYTGIIIGYQKSDINKFFRSFNYDMCVIKFF